LDQTKSGNEYQLLAFNFLGTVNSTVATLTVQTPPSIATQPANLTVVAGGTANFTVVASGTPAVTYQWQFSTDNGVSFGNLTDGGNITGSATANLSIANVTSARNGHQYQCVITNAGGTVTTSVAVLTVDFAPTFRTPPANVTVNIGGTANFTVVTNGNPAPTLQWQVSTNGGANYTNVINTANITGNTSTTLTISATPAAANGDWFRCVANNTVATVNSTAGLLTVNTPPTITVQPVPQLVNGRTTVVLSVTASGSSPISYQWMLNGANVTGATSATYVILSATGSFTGNYTVLVTNAGGNVTSSKVKLQVAMAPVIASQPLAKSVKRGDAAQFRVIAFGVQPLGYQWLKNGKRMVNGGKISGANGLELTIARTNITDVGKYSVVITNSQGKATSVSVPLMVN